MQSLLEWLQAFGALLAMAFGVYGLGVKPRDDFGRLTRKGKIVLTGIVVIGLLTFSTVVWQTYSRRQSSSAEMARFTRLLESVERTTYASKDGFISFDYNISLASSSLHDYAARLSQAYGDRNKNCKKPDNEVVVGCGDYEWSADVHEDAFYFALESSLAPRQGTEWTANQLIRFVGPSLSVYDHASQEFHGSKTINVIPEEMKDKIQLIYGKLYSEDEVVLRVRADKVPLANFPFANRRITSLTDILGKVLKQAPPTIPAAALFPMKTQIENARSHLARS